MNPYRRPGRAPLWMRIAPPLMILGVLLAALVGCTDTKQLSSQLTDKFTPNTHVYVEGGANPKLASPDKVNQQVLSVEQILGAQFDAKSPFRGIFIANLTDDSVTPDSLRQAFADKHGGFSGAIVVINHRGYFYRAFNVSKGWADINEQAFRDARDSHRGDLYGTVTTYLAALSHVSAGPAGAASGATAGASAGASPAPVTEVPAPAAPAPPVHHDYTGWWIALCSLLALVVTGLSGWGLFGWGRHRNARKAEHDQVQEALIETRANVESLGTMVYAGSASPGDFDVSPYHLAASTHLANAQEAFETKDYVLARAHLRQADRQVEQVDRRLHPDTEAVEAIDTRNRVVTSIAATTRSGAATTISNADYSKTRHGRYRHLYPGGIYQGVPFYPGYYPYPFWMYSWSPADVTPTSEALPDHWGGNYTTDNTYTSAPDYAGFNGLLTSWATSGGGSSSFDDDDDPPSYTPAAAPSHHHSSPGGSSGHSSHHSSSSSSSSSSSGGGFSGFDSGSFGGGGFSGGGFDSGGGSSSF